MEHGVGIVEDVPLAHPCAIAVLRLLQRPIGDVLAPVVAVLIVGVEGETLYLLKGYIQTWYGVGDETPKPLAVPHTRHTDAHVFLFTSGSREKSLM